MPTIHHGRYRGGNAHVRYSPVAVQEYTDATHSPFFNGRLGESLAALKRANAPKPAEVVVAGSAKVEREALLSKLLGLSSAKLAALLKRFDIPGRSKLRTKSARANALLGPVERLLPAEAEALLV